MKKKIRKAVLTAANKFVGTKKVTQTFKCWMTPGIKEAIKERNKLRKSRASNRGAWITACKDVRDMIGKECKRDGRNISPDLTSRLNPVKYGKQSDP